MVWAEIALLVIKLVMGLPAVQEWLERIFGALGKARPLQVAKEAPRVLQVLREKCQQLDGGVFTASCPISELALDLEKKYGT